MNPGKRNRVPEAARHGEFCATLGIPVLGEIRSPGTTEAGDMVWIDDHTLLVGHGYRTNAAGIAQMDSLLRPHGVEVLTAPLPYGAGPSECLHLMSLISLLDEKTALVDLPWLAVETVELLKSRGYRFIEIDAADPLQEILLKQPFLDPHEGRIVVLNRDHHRGLIDDPVPQSFRNRP